MEGESVLDKKEGVQSKMSIASDIRKQVGSSPQPGRLVCISALTC